MIYFERRVQKYLMYACAVLVFPGCASFHSVKNSELARERLTTELEDQIMSNLVRAYNGLPFAHYDVVSVQSQAGTKVSPKFDAGHSKTEGTGTDTLTTTSGAGGAVTSVVQVVGAGARTVADPLTYGISGERNSQVIVNIEPIYDKPEVYEAYVNFLNHGTDSQGGSGGGGAQSGDMITKEEKTTTVTDAAGGKITTVEKVLVPKGAPSRKINLGIRPAKEIVTLVTSKTKPREGDYIVKTSQPFVDGYYYYVPSAHKKQFSMLCMRVIARGGSYAEDDTVTVSPSESQDSEAAKAIKRLDSTLKSAPLFQD